VAVDILCRILSGALPEDHYAGSHFFGALKIDGFTPVDGFKKRMDAMIQEYRALPKAPGIERIYISGEIEQEIEKKRKTEGIPLNPSVAESLKELAGELGVKYDITM
jgi:LDH2 family malate/lactate/ureidoglycolate dehydrogenase